jgi:hypothetical protein
LKKYLNIPCAHCGEPFVQTDDVVVCPICGAPHHRDCYTRLGHCANEQAHASGEEWTPQGGWPQLSEAAGAEPEHPVKPLSAPYGPENYEDDANRYDSHTRNAWQDFQINGVSAAEMSAYIGPNTPYFLHKFSVLLNSSSQMSWNWTAFFFNYFYFFYRKMYTFGFVLLLFSVMNLIPSTLYTLEYVKAVAPEMFGITVPYNAELMEATARMLNFSRTINLGLSLMCGMYANKTYLRQIIIAVKKSRMHFADRPDSRAYYEELTVRGGTSKWAVMLLVGLSAIYYFVMMYAVYHSLGIIPPS